MAFIKAFVCFWRDVLSDNGSPSFGRVAAGTALLCSLKWVRYIVYKTGQLPDLLNILILVGGLYGIAKLSTVIEAFASSKAGVSQQTTVTATTQTKTGVA